MPSREASAVVPATAAPKPHAPGRQDAELEARGGASTRLRGRVRRLAARPSALWLLLYAIGVLAASRIRPEVVGANDASRYATMVALVEHHTFAIDAVPLARRTMDKVRVRGHEVSSKPPLLSTLGAGLYALLHHGAGLTFARDEARLVPVLVFALCTAPLLLLLWLLHGLLRREGTPPESALATTALLGLGTLLFPFGTILVNHVPSTTALFAAFVCAREVVSGRRSGLRWGVATGAAACLAVTFELTAVLPVLALSAYLIFAAPHPQAAVKDPTERRAPPARWRGRLGWAGALVLGAAAPAATHLALTWMATGGILPVQLRPDLWHYAGSYWNAPRSWDALQEPKWRYGWNCFLGGRGFFTLTPVLLLGFGGLLATGLRGPARDPSAAPALPDPPHIRPFGRPEAFMVLAGFGALASYIIAATNNYGGGHYGMRWFLMMVPWLGLFLPRTLGPLTRRTPGRLLCALLVMASLYPAQIFWFGKPTVYELLLMRHGLLVLPP